MAPVIEHRYTKQLEKTKELGERLNKVIAALVGQIVLAPLDNNYSRINDAYHALEESQQEGKDYIELFEAVLDAANFGDSLSDLKNAPTVIGEIIIGTYVEYLDDIAKKTGVDVSRYQLSADTKVEQLRKIELIVAGYISEVTSLIGEMERMRALLQSNFSKLQGVTSEEWGTKDWSFIAKSAGVGALAVAHPLIGIPMALRHFLGADDDQKNNDSFIENYMNHFDKLETKIEEVRRSLVDMESKVVKYCSEKNFEINCTASQQVLMELIKSGVNLDGYFSDLKKDEEDIVEMEQQYLH